MHVFVVYVCVCVYACVCMWELVCVWESVQVCVCGWWNEHPYVFVSALGSYEMGCHNFFFFNCLFLYRESFTENKCTRQSSPFCLNHTQYSNISRLCWHTNYLLTISVAVVPIMFKNLFLTKHITVISTTVLFVGCPVEWHWLHVCLQRLDLWLQCQLCRPGQNSGWPAQS